MLSILAFDQKERRSLKATLDDLPALQAREDVSLWIDIEAPTAADFALLKERFSFHPLALEDAQNPRHHPKLDEYHDHLFLIVHGVHDDATPERYKPVQLSMFVARRYLVTLHPKMDEIQEILGRCDGDEASLLADGIMRLVHRLMDRVVDEFLPLMVQIEKRVEYAEDQVFEPGTIGLLEEVFSLKRTLAHVRQTAIHQKEILHRLTQQNSKITTEEDRFFFRDIYDHVIRVVDQVDSLREVVSSVLEANVSLSSHRLNEVMKFLTILSTVFLPLTFVVGLYGMNFNPDASPWNMPELRWRYGYPVAVLVMIGITLLMLRFFRKKKWF